MKPDARYERLVVALRDAQRERDVELARIVAQQLAMYTRRR